MHRHDLVCIQLTNTSSDSWSLPGGHLEYGETFEECSKREVVEETGLEIEDVQFLTAIESFFNKDDRHYVTIFMTAVAKKGKNEDMMEPEVGCSLSTISLVSCLS